MEAKAKRNIAYLLLSLLSTTITNDDSYKQSIAKRIDALMELGSPFLC